MAGDGDIGRPERVHAKTLRAGGGGGGLHTANAIISHPKEFTGAWGP